MYVWRDWKRKHVAVPSLFHPLYFSITTVATPHAVTIRTISSHSLWTECYNHDGRELGVFAPSDTTPPPPLLGPLTDRCGERRVRTRISTVRYNLCPQFARQPFCLCHSRLPRDFVDTMATLESSASGPVTWGCKARAKSRRREIKSYSAVWSCPPVDQVNTWARNVKTQKRL